MTMTTSAATRTSTNDRSYENFLCVTKSGNSTTVGEDSTVRWRTFVQPAPEDEQRESTVLEGVQTTDTKDSTNCSDSDTKEPDEEAVTTPESTHSFLFTEPVQSPDLNIVLAMKRTLFATLNHSWLLALGGVGLTTVGNGDARATRGGAVFIVGAILSAVFAMVIHAIRVHGSSADQTTRACMSVGWTFLAVL